MVIGIEGERQARTYTERLRSSLMALISIFLRPMVAECGVDQTCRSMGEADEVVREEGKKVVGTGTSCAAATA